MNTIIKIFESFTIIAALYVQTTGYSAHNSVIYSILII
jgi:hypothetical protein